ncbi:serine/threonine protein kinase [Nocardioides aromaticivorans]|uniref:non-specific serine/threonine protein kinase n=1 Tax=Nocardioides aromaticivorans TaxID=200618 RepID=A0A7Y9ZH71_9ACTN|nr:serine/threonine-protein kinase [Nocardioides aromaticivorans]NYI44448.1 serine/threonine protein kinase [Nocardioides aromaticivorans]
MSSDSVIVLDDRYRLLDELGHGGMSDVFRATDELLQREVAVKVLREVEDPVLRARFIAEAQLLARLNHPGLVTLLDAGIRADRPYLVMTLAEGPTLAAQLAAGALPAQTVAEIGTQVAAALAYAHAQGVTHRDVKPSNVLLCGDSRALLADFGIARLAGDLEQHTRTGETIGSPAYLAPEQAAGEAVTSAADVYSLGLVLLEALTGERAFPGAPLETAVQRLVASPPMPVSLPRPWRDLLTAMTARDPAARPTAEDVAAATAAIATGTVPALPDPGESTQPLAVTTDGSAAAPAEGGRAAAHRGPRRRWLLVAALVVVAVAAALVLLLLRPSGDPEPTRGGTEVPANVPERYQQPLQELHDAIEEPR